MNGNYERWLEQEKVWVDAAEKKSKQTTWKYALLTWAVCIVALGAIGFFASEMNIQAMLQNMLIGFIAGMIMGLLVVLMTMPTWPAKRYKKELKNKVEKVLSPAEREEFATQMLGSDVKKISWIGEEKTEEKVLISRDYILSVDGRGWTVMIQLQKVKRIVSDVREVTVTTRGGGFKMQQTATAYLLRFYYQQPVEGIKTECDAQLVFSTREERERVSHILNEMEIGGQTL